MYGQQKNTKIELWRFILTCAVILMHAGILNGFYLAVDFFFMLSGFLLVRSCERTNESGWHFIFRKMKRIYPEYWAALLLILSFSIKYHEWMKHIDTHSIFGDFLEFFGLWMIVPFQRFTFVNGITWYVSVLIICQMIVWYLYQKQKSFFLYLFVPLSVLCMVSMFSSEYGHMDVTVVWYKFSGFQNWGISMGLFRGLTEMSMGAFLYSLYTKYHCKVTAKCVVNILNVLEIVLFAVSFFYMVSFRGDYLDFIMIFVLAGLIFISL